MRSLVLVLVLGVVSSCATASDIRRVNGVRLGDLQRRASFDLKCPRQNLVITDLTNKDEDFMRIAGVDGCGRRATYFWHGYPTEAWFMDAANE